jgi:molybdenum cofactor guanylyltransferase
MTTHSACAGLLLTGGASRRMGRDKASLIVPGESSCLARRTACLLEQVAGPVLEVGPGYSRLPRVVEVPAGGGPLAAVAAGWARLAASGWSGRVLVIATDLPLLTVDLLRWLVGHPSPRSVVPTVDGRVQPLCARYRAADLSVAGQLVKEGRRAMRDLVHAVRPARSEPPYRASLRDVDTPEDWACIGKVIRDPRTGEGCLAAVSARKESPSSGDATSPD